MFFVDLCDSKFFPMPLYLRAKLHERKETNAFRSLVLPDQSTDLSSNDYLGVVQAGKIEDWLKEHYPHAGWKHGSTGSRLLAGNCALAEALEAKLAAFHDSEDALIFNSGYDANLGLLSSVPQKNDHVIYDALAHASIRDGIRLSFAKNYNFRHNNMDDLRRKLDIPCQGERFIVTESVFSMDGDMPPMEELASIAEAYRAHLIIDEAHGIGVLGEKGEGLAQSMELHKKCFARIYTFGKAMGCHGAVIAGSSMLMDFLVNYCRSFIYTTALPEASLAAIEAAYSVVPEMQEERAGLSRLIAAWKKLEVPFEKLESPTAVQGIVVPGTDAVKKVELKLLEAGIQARAILSPTVPAGRERIRLVFHAFNTEDDLRHLQQVLLA